MAVEQGPAESVSLCLMARVWGLALAGWGYLTEYAQNQSDCLGFHAQAPFVFD